MKSGLLIVAVAVFLSGCTGSNRGKTVAVFSEGSSPAQLRAQSVTNDSRATNTSRNAESQDVIKAGDTLVITFTNLPSSSSFSSFGGVRSFQVEPGPMPAFDQRVKDDGTISLIYNRVFQAAGKRIDELEKEIRDYYVPEYFRDMTVMVRILCETQCVYVNGEFRKPGIYSWTNGMRLKDAIEAAGGFTEFAHRRVRLLHMDGTVERYRLRGDWTVTNNPALKPGDRVHNPRQIF